MPFPGSNAPLAGRAYYPALTGLRALAAYLVFFLHFRPVALPQWAKLVFGQFYVGVGIFFVLSGFVIATRYQGSVRWTAPWWRGYCWRRVARIYPAYLVLNGLVLARLYWPVPPGQGANSLLLVLLSQSLLRGFSSTLKYVGLPQGWSLTVEACFYALAPLLLLAWRRGRAAAAGFVAATVAFGLLLTYLCAGRPALHGFFGSYHHLFNFTFFGRVAEFVMGVGVARWWATHPAGTGPRGPWRTWVGGLLMALAVGLLAGLRSPLDWYDGLRYPAAIALNNLLFPAGVAVLLAGLLAERSWLRAALATPLMQALGRSSYFFYLCHVGVFSLWWREWFGSDTHIGWQFVATVLLSVLGYRLLEEPLRRWVLAWALPRRERTPATGAEQRRA